jgi:hypothetical protein
MNEFLITQTQQLEKDILLLVAEGEGSRAGERASSYFGYSASLDRTVMTGRLKPKESAQRRYIAAVCTARKVADIVRSHKICCAELDRVFAEFRQKNAIAP